MKHIEEHPASGVVVVGVDGSENSERAFDVALTIAKRFAYELKVIAAYTEPGYEYLPENTQGLAQENAQSVINDLVATAEGSEVGDRKSTRLNSSHVAISYAVFCLKKKKNTRKNQ